MLAFNLRENKLTEVFIKEEMTENIVIISASEKSKIEDTLSGEGYVYLDSNNRLVITGPKPNPDFVWNRENKLWEVNEELRQNRLNTERDRVWELIKQERSKHQFTGVYIEDIGKWFHTDQEALVNYAIHKIVIDYPEYEPIQWKTMDGSFVEMNPELFKKVTLSVFNKGLYDFKNAEKHRIALYKSNDPLNYDYSTGWSKGYNENNE